MNQFDQELELIKNEIVLFTRELVELEKAVSKNDGIDVIEKIDNLRLHLETILDSLDTIESMFVEDDEEDYDDGEDYEGGEKSFV